jgi:hypothetical protein
MNLNNIKKEEIKEATNLIEKLGYARGVINSITPLQDYHLTILDALSFKSNYISRQIESLIETKGD